MKETDIIGVIKSGLIRVAIRQVVKTFSPGCTLNFKSNLKTCESGTICPKCIIVESELIPEPMDLSLAEIKSKNPDGRILIIESKPCPDYITQFIYDKIKITDLEDNITDRFKSFLSVHEVDHSNQNDIISDREKDIVKLIALGKTNKEISDTLYISPHTVITHRKNITSKLGIKTIAGLTVYAVLNGIINPEEVKA